REQLIAVAEQCEVRTLATHIRHRRNDVTRNFLLHAEVPLLHIGPDGLVGNGVHREREQQAAADAAIAVHVELRSGQYRWWRAFQRLGVAFVAVGMLEEDAVAAADGHLAVALGIPRETDARGGVE